MKRQFIAAALLLAITAPAFAQNKGPRETRSREEITRENKERQSLRDQVTNGGKSSVGSVSRETKVDAAADKIVRTAESQPGADGAEKAALGIVKEWKEGKSTLSKDEAEAVQYAIGYLKDARTPQEFDAQITRLAKERELNKEEIIENCGK